MNSLSKVKVNNIDVSAYKIPTDQPESDGTLEWDTTTLILIQISAGGKTGLGYTYSHISTASLIKNKLADIIKESGSYGYPLKLD